MADKKISQLPAATTPLAGTEVLPIVQSGTTVKVPVSDLTSGRNVSLSQLTATATTQKLGAVTMADITVQIGPDTPITTSSGRILFNTSSTQKNWFINHNWNTAGALGFAQSTATGGSTMAADSHTWDSSGNYKIVNGNLVIGTSGKGVNFTANTPAAGMTSQLLNWYEEGTWTPSVGGTATYTAQSGKYTRIGRFVTVIFDMTINVIGTGSANAISGLPFTVGTSGAGMLMYFTGLSTSVTYLTCVGSNTSLTLTGYTAAATSATYPLSVLTSGTRIQMVFNYFI